MVQYVVSIDYLVFGSLRLRAVHSLLLITIGSRGAVGNWETCRCSTMSAHSRFRVPSGKRGVAQPKFMESKPRLRINGRVRKKGSY